MNPIDSRWFAVAVKDVSTYLPACATVIVFAAPPTVAVPASVRSARVSCAVPVSANGYTTIW